MIDEKNNILENTLNQLADKEEEIKMLLLQIAELKK